VGLGGADVALAAVTGQTWIEVPEAISVTYAGRLAFGLSGKDVILKTLGVLGRNTSALERSVEYKTETSDSVFSTDTRFTICNMTAELGGFNGLFEPNDETLRFLQHRGRNIDQARFFKADDDASYAEKLRIDIGQIPPQVAKPFSPDNVSDITDVVGQPLDGCFIGSCTTTEEELILAAMVLDHMWQKGLRPAPSTKRLVAPGDRETMRKLADLGLLAVYERAGFRVGVPGCHLCLGLG
jgi:3-isopropylmalate/(R)-2-methylmalate dehydratase large subunit